MAGSPDGMEAVIRIPRATETKAKIIFFAKKKDYGVVIEDTDAYRIVEKNTSEPFIALLYNNGSEWNVIYP